MSSSAPLRLLCYDISSDRLRRRVSRMLEEEATRVQFSVFEARLTTSALNTLVRRTTEQLESTDSLRVYTIGKTGERACKVYGAGAPIESGADFWLI